jgi:hypothetical protein
LFLLTVPDPGKYLSQMDSNGFKWFQNFNRFRKEMVFSHSRDSRDSRDSRAFAQPLPTIVANLLAQPYA